MFEDGDLPEDGDSKHEAGVTTTPVLSVGPQEPGGGTLTLTPGILGSVGSCLGGTGTEHNLEKGCPSAEALTPTSNTSLCPLRPLPRQRHQWGRVGGGIWVTGQSRRPKGARGGVTPGKLPCGPLVTTLAWLNARDSGPSCPSDRRALPAFLSPGGRGPLALNHSWKRRVIRALLPGPQAEPEKQVCHCQRFSLILPGLAGSISF